MKTLIELFDDRPLENILATEVFRPEQVVFLIMENDQYARTVKARYEAYFRHKKINTKLIFKTANMYHTETVLNALRNITVSFPDCALDITGGTDAALFAAGLLCASGSLPVFTYSRRRNMFFSINNAFFGDYHANTLNYSIEDFLIMAGGSMYTGRVENDILSEYMNMFDPFYEVFMKHRRSWVKLITFIQYISQADDKENIPLRVSGPVIMKKHGVTAHANAEALRSFEDIGLIFNLSFTQDTVSFTFRDHQCRKWLRDVGSVLELYVYKACLETGIFHDVRTSVVVNWEGAGDVSNEIDVMASRGITPFFISCKTGEVRTEAVNELAVLRDRFGGSMAKSAIVTASKAPAALHHRAMELNMEVIDYNLLKNGNLKEILVSLAG